MDAIKQEKVRRYEEFVDNRLKPDLVHAIAERYVTNISLLLSSSSSLVCSQNTWSVLIIE